MRMIITEHWPQATRFDGSTAPAYDHAPTDMGDAGYASIAEMQKELIKRFPQDGPTRIPTGIRYTTLSFGREMSVEMIG